MSIFRIRPDRAPATGWQILSAAGVPFYVEPSFLVFIAVVVLYAIQTNNNFAQAGLLGFVIFFSLLGHEGGHAMMARLLGYRDISVSLVMFGGNTHHPPATRGHSLAIALAGPLATLILAGAGYFLVSRPLSFMEHPAAQYLAFVFFMMNLFWLAFNLLPIFPMDGGQSLFYLFAFVFKEETALLSVAIVSMLTCLGAGFLAYHFGQTLACFFLLTFFLQNLQIFRSIFRR